MDPVKKSDTSNSREAASKFLTYIDRQTSQISSHFQTNKQIQDLDDYFSRNWDKIVQASCAKNGIRPDQLMAAVIELL